MPLVRCLACGELVDKWAGCRPCWSARKKLRNEHARQLGPCPQDVRCRWCGDPATDTDPMTWDHLTPISTGGMVAVPAHRSCNSRRRDRDRS